jgi:hypothetical protein
MKSIVRLRRRENNSDQFNYQGDQADCSFIESTADGFVWWDSL